MLPSHGYQGFRTAPIPSGWVQTGKRWALWYNGRETASVTLDCGPGVRLWMEGRGRQGSAGRQRPAGKALRRALVRGQALSISAPS